MWLAGVHIEGPALLGTQAELVEENETLGNEKF